jgi:hypothetical protein
MSGAIIGLIGAVFGAVAALVGSAFSDRSHIREEDIRWRRDQRVASYEGALRHLLRASNISSRVGIIDSSSDVFGATIGPTGGDRENEWFGELAESQFWMHTLVDRCEPAQALRLKDSMRRLDDAVGSTTTCMATESVNEIRAVLGEAIEAVSRYGQLYLSIGGTGEPGFVNTAAALKPEAS